MVYQNLVYLALYKQEAFFFQCVLIYFRSIGASKARNQAKIGSSIIL